ncbi:uncharacterized protein LOC129600562 [Paramacrobiotus metropolitanus]|uniref:uncharacterized protein LOC129600562 n=1 Tax=Paramacrobiotus metropolitanus TaxID=2943436 RepID=UPI002445C509|nr:uncharacterized protein LOC129600562 [Paramacrobiotus metropolitanus]
MLALTASNSLDNFVRSKGFVITGVITVAAAFVNAVITLVCERNGRFALVYAGTPISSRLSVTLFILAVHFLNAFVFAPKCFRHMSGTDLTVARSLWALLATIGLLLLLRTFSSVFGDSGRLSAYDLSLELAAMVPEIRMEVFGNGTLTAMAPKLINFNKTVPMATKLSDESLRLMKKS